MPANLRSPRYPQKSVRWAVDAALRILQANGLHPMTADVAARAMKYRDSNNGAARSALAALKAYGLLEKAGARLKLADDIQRYKLVPSQEQQTELLAGWAFNPPLFALLREKYGENVPSEDLLIHDLVIEFGFSEAGAKKAIGVYKENLDSITLLVCLVQFSHA